MLEFLRQRQRGIMIFVAVVVIIAFTFLFNPYDPRGGASLGTTDSFEINGQSVSLKTVEREEKLLRIAPAAGLTDIYRLIGENLGNQFTPAFSVDEVSQNRRLIREVAEDYGIHASEAEVEEATRANFAFQTNGVYDPDRYQDTINNLLSPNGLLPGDLQRMIADTVLIDKIEALLGANAHVPQSQINISYQRRNETIYASTIRFPFTDYLEGAEITEEEITNYYEKEKSSLLSAEKRKAEYVFFEQPKDPNASGSTPSIPGLDSIDSLDDLPELPELPDLQGDNLPDLPSLEDLEDSSMEADPLNPDVVPFGEDQIPTDPESDSPGQAPDEPTPVEEPTVVDDSSEGPSSDAPVVTTEEPIDPPAEPEAEVPFEKQLYEFGVRVDDFYTKLLENPTSMTALAEESGVTVTTTEMFSLAEPPTSPALPASVSNAIFNLSPANTSRVLLPVESTNPKGFYVVRVTEIEEPQPLTLETAKPRIEETLRKDKAQTQIETAVNETRDALTQAMQAGKKTFAEAAKELDLTVNEIAPFSPSKPPTGLPDATTILRAIYDTRTGEISDMIRVGDDALIAFVRAREAAPETKQAESDPDPSEEKETLREQLSLQMKALIFRGWLLEQRATANIRRNESVREMVFTPSFR